MSKRESKVRFHLRVLASIVQDLDRSAPSCPFLYEEAERQCLDMIVELRRQREEKPLVVDEATATLGE